VAPAARTEAAALRARYEENVAAAAAGTITPKALGMIEAKLLPKIEEAEKPASSLSAPPKLRDLLSAGDDVAARWEAMAIPARKDVLRVLFAKITLNPGTRGRCRQLDPRRVAIEWKTVT